MKIDNRKEKFELSNLPNWIFLLFWTITNKRFKRTINIPRLFNISALVSTWTAGIVDSTKYLFPIAPNSAPIDISTLDPNSFNGTRKTKHEIIYAKNEPKKSFKNSHPPDLEITIENFPIG